jgi:hypothetical protein
MMCDLVHPIEPCPSPKQLMTKCYRKPVNTEKSISKYDTAALAAIHNFIQNHDPQDINEVEGLVDPDPGMCTGELSDGIPRAAEREWANVR